jgi:hypothetical protein
MSCNPLIKCAFTAALDGNGRRVMISMADNKKYPIPHTVHPRCDSCADEELAHGKLMVLFNNDTGLVEQYEKLHSKN